MPGIPAALNQRLRETLLRCGPLESHAALKAVFVDARLAAWQEELPETSSQADRADQAIEFLFGRWDERRQNGLVLLLQVLGERADEGDLCRQQLLALAEELALQAGVPPALPVEDVPEMVPVPAGPFLMGSRPEEAVPAYEKPQNEITLPAFSIARYPVTNRQYAIFMQQTGRPAPGNASWPMKQPPRGLEDHPVTRVTWQEARDYCAWLSAVSGQLYRLPTEAEWEKAARGLDGRTFPWGDEWDGDRCNHDSHATTPVAAFPGGASPYGCLDMVGNVWEWVSTAWGSDWHSHAASFPYPWQADGREQAAKGGRTYRLYRGGSYADDRLWLRCAARAWYSPDFADGLVGFRLAGEGL